MVYETDFYTTRRPYRPSPSLSSYTVSKREIPWEKVPFVPRPSLVPDPVTAYGKRTQRQEVQEEVRKQRSIFSASEREKIRPKILIEPPLPYVSARQATRERVLEGVRRQELHNRNDSMDVLLPRLHKVAENPQLPYKRRMFFESDLPPVW